MAHERAASVHMPRIGCGLAGGEWGRVESIVRDTLCAEGIEVTVYDLPSGEGEGLDRPQRGARRLPADRET
jgi:hypothetical protein